MRNFLTSTLFLYSFLSSAQIEIGHYTDADGKPIVGFLDQRTYNPMTIIDQNMISYDFERGSYYDQAGKRVDGFIQFKTDKFLFKTHLEGKSSDRLDVKEIQSLIIGQDSFFVSTNFAIDQGLVTKKYDENNPQFLQFLCSFDGMDYAVFIDVRPSEITKHYLTRPDTATSWQYLPSEKTEIDNFFFKYFLGVPSKLEESKSPLGLIKKAEYIYKYRNEEPILYDQWWNEVYKPEEAIYHAYINSIDSIWSIDYYDTESKLYSAEFRQIYPSIRHGMTTAYYSDVSIRNKNEYEEGNLIRTWEYYENGILHYLYNTFYEDKVQFGLYNVLEERKELGPILFDVVNDESGYSVLDYNGNGLEILLDHFNNRQIHRTFKNGELIQSYYEGKEGKIYQWLGESMSLKRLYYNWEQSSVWDWTSFIETKFHDVSGIKLFSVLVNQKGVFTESKSLNSLFAEIDSLTEQFFEVGSTGQSSIGYRSNKLKVNGEKVTYEVVIPMQFGIFSLYKEPNTYNYNYMFHHQMMMNQFQFTPPSPPTFR